MKSGDQARQFWMQYSMVMLLLEHFGLPAGQGGQSLGGQVSPAWLPPQPSAHTRAGG